jgi:hypothetical protein
MVCALARGLRCRDEERHLRFGNSDAETRHFPWASIGDKIRIGSGLRWDQAADRSGSPDVP